MKIDPPHEYATEQGSIRSRYCQDFRNSAGCFTDTWRDPVSGLVMLNPSFRKRDFRDDFKGIANWRQNTDNIAHFRALSRSRDTLALMSSTRPAGVPLFITELTAVSAGIAIFEANNTFYDNLLWALESNFTLNIDEGFAIHYRGLTDELLRKNNWFYIQWDNIGIHMSHAGHVRVCYYSDRGHLGNTPEVVHEFDIAEPGQFIGKSGHFVFIPAPGYGLLMLHTEGAASHSSFQSNTSSFAIRNSHIIPWNARYIGTHYRLFESSLVRIALNPFHANAIGFQNITFPTSGTYVEEKFDPGYKPATSPDDVSALSLLHFGGQFGSVTATLRNPDNSADWAAGTDRQGRISFALTTSDDRYSPIVYGWGVAWNPIILTRDSGEITVYEDGYNSNHLPNDVLRYLELTDDSEGHFEGEAHFIARTPELIKKLERGDATYQVEYSEDADEWTVYNGGILKVETEMDMDYMPASGFEWHAKVNLHGQEERFDEIVHRIGTAFDNSTIAEDINLILRTSGFYEIREEDLPGPATNRRLPQLPKGTNFRFVPQPGDSLKKILRDLMLMVRAQWVEVKLKYDWEAMEWMLVQRERNPSEGWILTYDDTQEDFDDKTGYYNSLKMLPHACEVNVLQVLGQTTNDNEDAEQIPSTPIVNQASLTDPESVDYAGRVKAASPVAPGLTTVEEVNRMARTIEPRVMHRNLTFTITMAPSHFSLDIPPDTYITLRLPPIRGQESNGDREFPSWVKKRVLVVDAENHTAVSGDAGEVLQLFLDETWENAFKGEGE